MHSADEQGQENLELVLSYKMVQALGKFAWGEGSWRCSCRARWGLLVPFFYSCNNSFCSSSSSLVSVKKDFLYHNECLLSSNQVPDTMLSGEWGSCLGWTPRFLILLPSGEEAGDCPIVSQGGDRKGREMPRLLWGYTEELVIRQEWVTLAKSHIQKWSTQATK